MNVNFSMLLLVLLSTVICFGCMSKQKNKKFSSDTPIIVWWADNLFPHVTEKGEEHDLYEVHCPKTGVTCVTSQNRSLINETTNQLLTVIIYGTDFRAYEAPLPRKSNHLWALLHEESPQNNQVLLHKEALSVFNFSSTFKRQSDFPLTTQHIPSLEYFQTRKPVSIQQKNKFRDEGLATAVYLQSHCDVPSDRDRYVRELMRNMSVDSYGGCLHNKDFDDLSLMDTSKMNDEAVYDLIAKYKFHLAFENAICDDYISEKFVRPFHLGSIPVYFGSESARDWAPRRDAVIMVKDFESPAKLAKYLNFLDDHDEAYAMYLRYKDDYNNSLLQTTLKDRTWSADAAGQDSFVGGYECYVCEKMHEIQNDVKAGRPVISRQVPPDHLNCPVPKPSVGSIDDISPADHIHRWVEDYHQSSDQAAALKEMVENQSENAGNLWEYIEERYSAGKGALQHTEL